jgi:hypothetical protein
MPSVRARRLILWAAVLLPLLAAPIVLAVLRAWLDGRMREEIALGGISLRLHGAHLGWDLGFSADSVALVTPGFTAGAGSIRAELRLWRSLVSLSPSMLVLVDTLRVDLPSRPDRKGPRLVRLRGRKARTFPSVRFPIPFRLETERVRVMRGGIPVAEAGVLAFYSQGPKGAAIEWAETLLHSRADSASRDPLVMKGAFKASARWFGAWVRYQARALALNGDGFSLEGERRKADLGVGRDSVEMNLSGLERYARLLGGRPPEVSGIRASASLATVEGLSLTARASARVPGPLRMGPLRATAEIGFQDSSGRLVAAGEGERGGKMYLQGRFRLPLADSVEPAALVRAFSGEFSGFSRDVRFPLGGKVLPGDLEIKSLRVKDGGATAQVRSRDNTQLSLRVFRDSSWRMDFEGVASPTETWAHAWTDTNVAWRSAWVNGRWHRGQLAVEVRGKGVRAYGAAADSLWARNIIRRRGYYLDSSILHYRGETWPVAGKVEWTGRKAVRGPRGLRLRREVSLSFRAEHRRHGRLEYAMPRRRSMVVTAHRLALERLPVPRLSAAFPYHPSLSGRFAWDWEAREGDADLSAAFLYGGDLLGVAVEAGWDAEILELPVLEAAYRGSRLRLGAQARLAGRQFHQARRLGLKDVISLSLEAERFEASHLASILPGVIPLDGGVLNGRLTYADTSGFRGVYRVDSLQLRPLRKFMAIPSLTVSGEGFGLRLSARTSSAKYPWLNDTLDLRVTDPLGDSPALALDAVSAGGLALSFRGGAPGLARLEGEFNAKGDAALPGGGGTVEGFQLGGMLAAPLDRRFVTGMRIDSAWVTGTYAVAGLDTQSIRGLVEMRDGRLRIPTLQAVDRKGRTLAGEAEARLGRPALVTAKVKGEGLAVQAEGLSQLVFRDVEATVRADSSGIQATAKAAKAAFQADRGAVKAGGELEHLFLTYARDRSVPGGREPVPKVGLKARLRGFAFRHKIGFRDAQRFFRAVKVDKRRKRIRPVDLNVRVEAVGGENRIETDILRMYFTGDLGLRGVYPYTLLNGEISSLSGEIGQAGQSYNVQDFALKWQNATVDEGRVYVEGAKKLRVDCRPETERTCNVFIKLEGRLDEMAFTYDSDCGQTAGGEVIEPAALINSVSRGCYSGDYVSGAGGGGYGEAVFTFLEPTISDNLTRRVAKATEGWIKSTQVSGIGSVVARDTAVGSEPISLGMESREWKGAKLMAKAGYHPEKKLPNPWENRVALEWRPPLEKVARGSEWKRRLRDRVTLEASAETRPEEKLEEEKEREVRQQVGIRYRYKFWKLW